MSNQLNRLVRQLQAGDPSVFDQIYHLTYRKVFFVIVPILGDRSLAEDIMQDTYMRMLETLHSYKEKNFLAYLITIAKNLAINEYHRRKRFEPTEMMDDDLTHYGYDQLIETSLVREEIIREALSILEPTERNIVLLHDVEMLTHREIALIMDKPLGTITWMYARAVQKIRKHIREE